MNITEMTNFMIKKFSSKYFHILKPKKFNTTIVCPVKEQQKTPFPFMVIIPHRVFDLTLFPFILKDRTKNF